MKIIISPAKKMRMEGELLPSAGLPVFLEKTERLWSWMKNLDLHEAKSLWKCSDKIARENFERLRQMDLRKNLTPAILSYEGIQYQYMAPAVLDERALAYLQEHLRILSGFYGVLKPFDGVVPYRLEMQAKPEEGTGFPGGEGRDLYDFWGAGLYEKVMGEDPVVVNLASREYSRCIEPFLKPGETFLTCIFGERDGDKVKQKGTLAKMARGEMVRYMAERQIESPEQLKEFEGLGYRYSEKDSSLKEFTFIKE